MRKILRLIKQMDKMNAFMWFFLTATAAVAGVWFVQGLRHNFYRDASWDYYTKRIGLDESFYGPDEVENILGKPKSRELNNEYVKLNYESFSLGFLSENQSSCAIFITDSTVKLLRDEITIGSLSSEIEKSYGNEREMREGGGIILGKDDHAIADGGGIWIYYKSDTDGIIQEIVITNGL